MELLRLDQPRGHCETTVTDFLTALPQLLRAMALDARRFVMVAEFSDSHYVQFWIEADGHLLAETSTTPDGAAFHTHDVAQSLRKVGWSEPHDAFTPNWWTAGEGHGFVLQICTMITTTLYSIMIRSSNDAMFIHFWTPVGDPSGDPAVRLEARVSHRDALRALRRHLDRQ